jgi:hypothetical protein
MSIWKTEKEMEHKLKIDLTEPVASEGRLC